MLALCVDMLFLFKKFTNTTFYYLKILTTMKQTFYSKTSTVFGSFLFIMMLVSGMTLMQSNLSAQCTEKYAFEVFSYTGSIISPKLSEGAPDLSGTKFNKGDSGPYTREVWDMGETIPSGTQICANVKLDHCSNSFSSHSRLKFWGGDEASQTTETYVGQSSVIAFGNTSYAEICFTSTDDWNYIKITDEGGCAFKVDNLVWEDCAESSFNTDIFNDCGTNKSIDVYAKGILSNTYNCISYDNTNAIKTIAEVWIQRSQCNGNTFPSSITISSGGESVDVAGIAVAQNSTSSIPEMIFRVEFDGSADEVCITDLSGCISTSIVLYVEKNVNNASSSLSFVNVELDDNFTPLGSDDCASRTLQIGGSELNQNIKVLVPVHEKADDGRTAKITATALAANGTQISQQVKTFSAGNAGQEAALYEFFFNNISGTVASIQLDVCSPDGNGDSFGLGGVAISSEDGCQVAAVCPIPPKASINASEISWAEYAGADVTDCTTGSNASAATYDELTQNPIPTINPVTGEQVNVTMAWSGATNCESGLIRSLNGGENQVFNLSLDGNSVDDCSQLTVTFDSPVIDLCMRLIDVDIAISTTVNWQDQVTISPVPDMVENATNTSYDGNGTFIGQANCDSPIDLCNSNLYFAGPLTQVTFDYCYGPDVVAADPARQIINFDGVLFTPASQTPLEITCDEPSVELFGNTLSDGSSYAWTGPNNFSSSAQNITVTTPGVYTLTVTDPDGCESEITYEVLDDTEVPSISASNDGPLTCDKTSVTLTGNTDGVNPTYTWTDGNGSVISTDATATVSNPGTYTLTVVNTENGCTNTTETIVEENTTAPGAVASNDGPITCGMESIQISGNATASDVSYAWTGPAGFIAGTQNATVSLPGTYNLVVTDNVNGCTSNALTVVSSDVNGPQLFVITDTITCTDPCVDISVNSPIQNLTYQWYDMDGNLIGDTKVIEVCSPGIYIVIAMNQDNGCTSQAFVSVTEIPCGDITGTVLEDTNNDNIGDEPIEGVIIQLVDADGNVVATDTTDADGNYSFENVPPGDYTITEVDPDGFTSVTDNMIPVTVIPGESANDNDFIDERLGSISGTVLQQLIADGDIVAEIPISGVIVNLLDEDGNIIATDTTDASGNYLFDELNAGDYTVQEVDPTGFSSVRDEDTSEDGDGALNIDTNDNLIPVVLMPGEDDEDNDFVDVVTSEITGTVLEDTDGDGLGDTPIEGVIITLTDEDGNVVATDTTDANGGYSFEGLIPGDYTITEIDPNGYTSVSDVDGANDNTIEVTLDSGASSTDNDFVDEQLGSIAGTVLEDLDGDGAGDTPIEGVIVSLLDDMGNVIATDTTDANGDYSFPGLQTGNYTVVETDPNGFTSVTPNEIPVSLDAGASSTDNDFVDEQLGSIAGTVLEDLDGDGTGDTPIEGVIVSLLDDMGNVIATDTTDANGDYSFPGLQTGDYTVVETDPNGFTSVTPNEIPVSLDAGDDSVDNDFVDEQVGDISGTVLEDIDGDGVGDEPIEGVIITLLDDMGNVVATDTTDANGDYSFDGILPGDYTIVETDPNGYDSITPNEIPVTLTPGGSSTDNDFVDEQLGAVSGFVLEDTNNDDIGDIPIEGVIVNLVDENGNVVDIDTTDAAGAYNFDNVLPGEYTVEEVDPNGFDSVTDEDTSDDGDTTPNTDTNDNSIPVTVDPNESDDDNIFVDEQLGAITGNVTEDIDGDDLGEEPIEGVVITLLDNMSNVIATDTTDGNGDYSFENLPAGEYTVVEEDPDGFVSVTANEIPVTLDPGEIDENNDFVDEQTAEISGTVLEDLDGDGIGNEPIEGVIVTLLDDMGNVVAIDTTDENGDYSFEDVLPGDYTIVETDPDGYDSVSPNEIPVTLNPGESSFDNDFIDEQPGSISGKVEEDIDGDGNGDTPINNVTVVLFDDAGNPVDTFVTGPTGTYQFNDVAPGEYTVVETDPIDYVSVSDQDISDDGDTTPNTDMNDNSIPVTVNSGEADDDNNFVDERPASISGQVTEDIDGDDVGEDPIEGVVISLIDEDGNVVAIDTTDLNGDYSFEDLTPGIYTVTEEDPDGFTSVNDSDGGDPNSIQVDLGPAENSEDNDFVDEALGSISGNVSEDTDGDEIGDEPLDGVIVNLLDENGNVIATDTTDANGDYNFPDLPAGDYTVVEMDPDGYDSVTPNEIPVTLDAGEDSEDNNFVDEIPGSVSGFVLEDTNNDDIGDIPIEGVIVDLVDADGNVVDTDTTDAGGFYNFDNVSSGEYTVEENDLAGFDSVADEDTSDDGDTTPNTDTNDNSIPLTVEPGEMDDDNIFVDEQLGAITGNVSLDTDNDDQGEEPIEGVIITLLDDMGNVVATDTTDANGNYSFEGLEAGEYTVVEMDPDGLNSVTPNEIPVTLDPGEIDENNDFIDEPTTDVSGTVLEDIDGDGIGDEPIEGVVVELIDEDGLVVATDTTDENGDYNFEDVEPGDYTIVETDPNGYDSVTPNEIPVTVMPGVPSTANDFVDEQLGSVSGNVSEDTDGDEMGDTPIEGVIVSLLDDMGNVVDTDTTDANGDYIFEDVTPGEYTVEEVDPMDYISVSDEDSSDDGDTTPNTDTNDNSVPVTVTPGETDEDNNFVDEVPGSVSGNVSEDTNGDGTADLPLEGVVVNLLDDMNTVVATDTTDANGDYNFNVVAPGEYTVEEVDPADYISVRDEDTSDDGDANPNTDTNDNSIPVTVESGEADEDNNFIDELPGSISGNVSEDTDADGLGDTPLENVVVNLVDDMGTVVATDSTDANGDYNFDNVTPGEYTVEEVDPDVLGSVSDEDTSDDGDTTPNTDTNDNSIPVTVTPGEADDDNNFVDEIALTAGLGNRVWEDLNNNGLQDDGEPGINGALVSLFEIENGGLVPVAVQTTAGDGNYLFTDLDPSKTFVITLQNPDPTAYFFTAADQGDETLDSDFNPVSGLEATLASTVLIFGLIENSIDSTYDAGLVPFGSISGNVAEDLDNDDIADQAIENVIVILTDGNTGAEILRDTTDADGNYDFSQVLPGEYVIIEEDPADFASVSDEDVSDDGDLVANTNMNDNEIPVTLEPGEADDDNNFVDEVLVTTIFGHIYFDSNGNGVQDGFEPNIPNLDVLVQQSDGSFVTATTDDEGNWSTPVLPGLTITTIDTTDFDYPSGAIQTEGTLSETNVVMEGTMFDAGIDGFYIPTTVFGVVYYDSNNNGDQDADEPGLEGIEVIIMDDSGIPQTVLTDSLGNWSADVIPGMVEALVDTDNPVLPSSAEQTEGDNPTTITAILGMDNDMGNDGYFFCVEIDVQVLLQGSLIESSYTPASPDGLMRTELNMRRFLPGQDNRFIFAGDTPAGQPYSIDPWAYMGEEGAAFDFTVIGDPQAGYPLDVTDWVLVSLRSTIFPDSEICKRAALLQSDGQIIFIEEFDCCGTLDPNQPYYIVIEHRNHVPVMTPTAVNVVDGVIAFDFRAEESYTGIFGSATGQAIYDFQGGSVFCMVSGNPDQIGAGDAQDINVSDLAFWSGQSGLDTGYFRSDVNMDGDVNSDDRAIIENNFGNTSGIPFNY